MLDQLIELMTKKVSHTVKFNPEIKVKRETDTLYISEVRKTKVNFMAVVEVYNSQKKCDKAPLPIGVLSEVALRAIFIRLTK